YRMMLPGVSAIDVEGRSDLFQPLAAGAREQGKAIIASFHDFQRTPALPVLRKMAFRARKHGATVVKIAAMIRGVGDIAVLYQALELQKAGPLCVIGMGPLGMSTRIGLPCLGSCLAYGHLERASAPGQIHCEKMKTLLQMFSCHVMLY
ncbi:MAG: type I 3-dehydroquinate dehydratase, partial [Lentisphaerota bacterium]